MVRAAVGTNRRLFDSHRDHEFARIDREVDGNANRQGHAADLRDSCQTSCERGEWSETIMLTDGHY